MSAACHKCLAVSCAGTPYRGSRSYSNLGQLMSDSESTTPVAPGAASPTRAAGHNRSVSALSNGSTLNSPFGTQGARHKASDTEEHDQVVKAVATIASSPMVAAKR